MSTLPANSTFLPVLDDLLSPDFRTVTIPGQTPQTPAETPVSANKTITFAESHTGQLTTKTASYAATSISTSISGSMKDSMTQSQINGVKTHELHRNHGVGVGVHSPHHAAQKIQQWWKHRKGKVRMGNGTLDMKAERAKHAIRHNRTDEHVRFLETEVHRLKSALATERKLRSLQLEAIRSLWSQVQKVSSISSSPGAIDVMSMSMPNGLSSGSGNKSRDSGAGAGSGCAGMSMSLHEGILVNVKSDRLDGDGALSKLSKSESVSVCSCTKEIQGLRESFSSEMGQLRRMIDQLKTEGGTRNSPKSKSKTADNSSTSTSDNLANENAADETDNETESKISQQKRPLTLNLVGHSNPKEKEEDPHEDLDKAPEIKKEEIAGYATQMASNILQDAKENDKETETDDANSNSSSTSNVKAKAKPSAS